MTGPATQDSENVERRLKDWRRTLAVVWVGEVLSIAGFNAVIPFLPFYIRTLGVTGAGEVEWWSGLLLSGQAWTMFVMGPIWGTIADRISRKMMLQRAMYGGALLLAAMGFVTNVQQLLALRVIQGAVTGTVSAAFSLVASCTPDHRRTSALGVLQMGVYVGGSLGPVIGGVVADTWGYRACFIVTGVLLGLGGVLITLLVHEIRDGELSKDRSVTQGIRMVLGSSAVVSVFAVSLILRTGLRVTVPILALFVQMLVPAETRTASIVGFVSSLQMAGTAAGSLLASRFGDRLGVRRFLLASALGCGLAQAAHATSTSVAQMGLFQALSGCATGAMLTALSSTLASVAPDGRQGVVFGLDSSIVAAANAIGPMVGAAVAATYGLRLPWLVAGALFGAAVLLVTLRRPAHAMTG